MKTRTFIPAAVVALLALGLPYGAAGEKTSPSLQHRVQLGRYQLSGPYQHANLTLFLIHGKDRLPRAQFWSLQEALEKKQVIVHETQNVNELAMENRSREMEIFVQSGDIVKGGQQDRTIAFDLVLPRRSGKIAVTSFCVEAGRWQMRPGEDDKTFASAEKHLPSHEGKIAVRGTTRAYQRANIQGGVWQEVARKQMMLGKALGKSVQSGKSATSLQLTLEHRKLLETVATYTKKLAPVIEGKNDVIGYAFAINGEINSADVYASHRLFVKFWPKLLNATVVEAIAEGHKGKKFVAARLGAVQVFLADAEKGKAFSKQVTPRIRLVTRETKKNVLFITRDQKHQSIALRKNYLAKSSLPLVDLNPTESSRSKK